MNYKIRRRTDNCIVSQEPVKGKPPGGGGCVCGQSTLFFLSGSESISNEELVRTALYTAWASGNPVNRPDAVH